LAGLTICILKLCRLPLETLLSNAPSDAETPPLGVTNPAFHMPGGPNTKYRIAST